MKKVIKVARAISNSAGAAPLHAAVRQGADEISQILPAFPAQSVQPVAEPGQMLEPTQQQVTDEARGRAAEASSSLKAMMDAKPQQGPKQERGRER